MQTESQMNFERIFESGANRVVMIGLFLALLELIRERLVAVEQSEPLAPIYLRSLTDEPAEQAVQKAILATAETGNDKVAQNKQQQQPPIPVAQLPPKSKQTISPDEYEKQEIQAPQDDKQQTKN